MSLDCVAPDHQERFLEHMRRWAQECNQVTQGAHAPKEANLDKMPAHSDIWRAKEFLEVIIAHVTHPTPTPFIFEDLRQMLEQLRDILNGEDPMKDKNCPY